MRPHGLARPRTSASQAENTGSNPVGATTCMVLKHRAPLMRVHKGALPLSDASLVRFSMKRNMLRCYPEVFLRRNSIS